MIEQKLTKWTADQENYMEWLILPVQLRNPKTKTEYAEHLGISRTTLWNWENAPGFDDERRQRIKIKARENTPDIIEKLKEKALSGDVSAMRLYFEWVEGIENKIHIEQKNIEPLAIKIINTNKEVTDGSSGNKTS